MNVDVSTSTDGGATWSLNPVTTPETIDDREWIAADTNNKVCISYHDAPQGITVGCSPNAGLTFTQFASAIDANHAFQTGDCFKVKRIQVTHVAHQLLLHQLIDQRVAQSFYSHCSARSEMNQRPF